MANPDVLAWLADGCLVIDPELRCRWMNRQAGAMLGLSPDALVGRPLPAPPGDAGEPPAALAAIRVSAEAALASQTLQCTEVRDPATGRWLEARLHPAPDGALAVLRDVTARKQSEARAAAHLAELRQLVEQAPAFLWVVDPDLRVRRMYGAEALLKQIGSEHLLGKTIDEGMALGGVPEEVQRMWHDMHVRALHGGNGEYLAHYAEMAVEARVQPLRDASGAIVGILGVGIDVTEQERTRARLREKEELHRILTENATDIITLYDAKGRRVYASPSAERVLGPLPDGSFAGVHPDDLPGARELWDRIRAGERTEVTFRHAHADGTWRWLQAEGSLVHYRGAPHVMAITRDVTEQMRAREALRAREARFRALVEHGLDLIAILDEQGVHRYASPSYEMLLGYTPQEMVGTNAFDFVHPDDQAMLARVLSPEALRDGPKPVPPVRIRHRNGSWRTLIGVATDMRGEPSVGGIVANGRDVTELLLLEEQLRQAQKMEAIGQLAGGVAHDFNNLLTVIAGYSDFIRAATPPDDERRGDAEEIRRAADRASLLTQQLLAFSRKQVLRPEVLDLNAVVDDVSRLLRRLIGEDVALDLRLAPDAGAVLLDAGQLQQVLMNLAVNARDAMPTGGRLTVTTTAAEVGRETAAQPTPLAPGRYARLAVSDTGVGMTPEVVARCFEPFFTTKEPGRGTGLGLSTVYGVVTQSGGRLRVASAPGQGTTIALYFPRVEPADAAPEDPSARAAPRGRGGTETVLLVEDDPMVRRMTGQVLSRVGYRVLAADGAGEALRLAGTHDGPIDLVVTDVVMPELPGPELVARLEALRPGLRVLYMSGYTEDTMTRHGLTEGRISFVGKPFSPDALVRRVRAVLDGEG